MLDPPSVQKKTRSPPLLAPQTPSWLKWRTRNRKDTGAERQFCTTWRFLFDYGRNLPRRLKIMPTTQSPRGRVIPAGQPDLIIYEADDYALFAQFSRNDNTLEVWDYIMRHSPRGQALWRQLADLTLRGAS